LYCLVGLGNPGSQYKLTRHNAGFLVIDKIAEQNTMGVNKKGFNSLYGEAILGDCKVLLVKPQTYMNLSGEAVYQVIDYYKIAVDKILIIYDDLDLPLGAIRVRLSGSSGGHKGLGSIINTLGTDKLPRLKIGIGRPANDLSIIDYVLTPFSKEEQQIIKPCIIRGAEAATCFVIEGSQYVMNHFNQKSASNESSG
jgi:PTH1 family peptidyl-tRNA hydrolase